jgi:hypothetical protein
VNISWQIQSTHRRTSISYTKPHPHPFATPRANSPWLKCWQRIPTFRRATRAGTLTRIHPPPQPRTHAPNARPQRPICAPAAYHRPHTRTLPLVVQPPTARQTLVPRSYLANYMPRAYPLNATPNCARLIAARKGFTASLPGFQIVC